MLDCTSCLTVWNERESDGFKAGVDLIAFALAVAAEQRRSTSRIQKDGNSSYCAYDSDIATGLGVGAILFLLTSQTLLMIVSRCLCCGKALRPSGSRSWAIVLFITSWVFFFIAEACLLAGSVRNAYHTKYRTTLTTEKLSCETLRKGIFGAGAAFVFFTGIVSDFYYISYSKADDAEAHYARDNAKLLSQILLLIK